MAPVAEHHVANDERLHLSPSTSSERLIGQPERLVSVMFGFHVGGHGALEKKLLAIFISYLRIQPVQIAISYGGAAMAKLVMWNLMTLDGFVEGPNRDISGIPHLWAKN